MSKAVVCKDELGQPKVRRCVWLAGDSTLDNKAREPFTELMHYLRFRALQVVWDVMCSDLTHSGRLGSFLATSLHMLSIQMFYMESSQKTL